MAKKFNFTVKVYYEDTDAGGVVYYANYLKFLERARSEAIYSLGYTNLSILENFGILLIVKSCNIEYVSPAKLEDKIQIFSSIASFNKASFVIIQNIKKDDNLIVKAILKLVTVNQAGKPIKIPPILEKKLLIN